MVDIFIPSYHRPDNCKTVNYYLKLGYDPKKIHVFLDSEADDIEEYKKNLDPLGVNIHVFDMNEARERYDYIHRASPSLRSAGQARNMFMDFAKENGIDFYMVQDNDTSLYTGVMNEGYFTGSLRSGLTLFQTLSATAKGGLTDLYNECKLYNKAMVTPLQFPSAIHAEKQPMNGGRIHHRINYRYLFPCIMKGDRSNIEWDAYPEDVPFTNEPKRNFKLR